MKKILKSSESLSVIQSKLHSRKSHKPSEKEPRENTSISLGHIGRLPNYNRGLKYTHVESANRYLHFQEKRIDIALSNGHYNKAIYIWICLLKVSKSYQIQLFHRVKPNWYWIWPTTRVEETLFGAINKLRSWDTKLLINRFYIQKKSGKWRPIGSPNIESRMISKALTDMVYAVSEKFRSPEQHGYIRNRGSWSAIVAVVQKLKEGYQGYEFDLKSFFNTVEPYIYLRKLEELSKPLTKIVGLVIKNIEYRYSELKPESELHPKEMRKNTLVRTGVPQGLSLSPILSTWALEYYGRPNNLIMYADDGIYFFKHNISAFMRWIEKMGEAGIQIAPEKSGMLKPRFKFCGAEIDSEGRYVEYEGVKVYWDAEDFIERIKRLHVKHYKKEPWIWNVHKDSFITHRDLGLSILAQIKIAFYSLWSGKPYKGYRVFPSDMRVYDILGSSSWSVNELFKITKYKGYEFESIKPFDFGAKTYSEVFSYAPKLKGSYKKHYNNGNGCTKPFTERMYWEILEYHNLKLTRLRPTFEK